jgi:predicted negative regulator of RcsB-dependent stress response
VKYQDQLHISKYSTDYENVILEMDDNINNRMLHTALSMDVNNPHETLSQLAQMDLAKSALNKVMVFIDKH